MIISLWAIVGTILCIWFIASDRNYFGIPAIIVICLLIYIFLPLIMLLAAIYAILWLLWKE